MFDRPIAKAWRICLDNLGVIAALTFVIWLPLNLISCHMDDHFYAGDESWNPFRLYDLTDNGVGVLSAAAVILIASAALQGRRIGFNDSLSGAVGCWGRILLTRVLTIIPMLIGLILLIVPGVYLTIGWTFAETVSVVEGRSGVGAMRRSWELTEGRFWELFKIFLKVMVPIVLLALAVYGMTEFVSDLDNWVITAFLLLPVDLAAAFATVVIQVIYQQLMDAAVAETGTVTDVPPGSAEDL